MRYLKLTVAALLVLALVGLVAPTPTPVYASVGIDYKFQKPLGYQLITNPIVAVGLVLPDGAKHAMLSVRDNGVMMRDDGTNPTATNGFFIPAGSLLNITNDRQWLLTMKFINSADGATKVYILYYGDR